MPLRFVFTKEVAIFKPAIVKEREKNASKRHTSKILHTQSKLQGEIFKLAKFCNKRIILKS